MQKIDDGYTVSRLVIFQEHEESIENKKHCETFNQAIVTLRGWIDEAENDNSQVPKV
jgi:hypothetical protein